MSEVTLHPAPQSFPVGTTVKIKQRPPVGGRLAGEPGGATLSEPAVATDGSLTVTGVQEGIEYLGYANVGGVDRYLSFAVSSFTVEQQPTTWSGIGLVDPRSSPYNAKLDGSSDDYTAFKQLHDDVNSGAIRGYYVASTAKITKKLPVLTKAVEILFFNGATLDFSEATEEIGVALRVEGSIGSAAELTADASAGQYSLKVATAYADGTLLKLTDPTTDWDTSTKGKPGEILEVGSPSGGLVGAKVGAGAFAVGPITAGQMITEIRMTNVNPEEAGASIIPASGTIEVDGEVYTYTSVTFAESKARFVITEQEAAATHAKGAPTRVVPPAGTVYLRTPVTHELGYTAANKAKVAPITSIGNCRITNPRIKGPASRYYVGGIDLVRCHRAEVHNPTVEDCAGYGVRFYDTINSHIHNPIVSNTRWVYYENAGLEGYGIVFVFATQDCSVTGGRTVRTRHTYTQGGGGGEGLPRRNTVSDHTSVGAFADAYDSHGGCYDVTFIRCTAIRPNGQGFNINCPKAKLTACRATQTGGYGVLCQSLSPIGATEYDIDCEVIAPRIQGITVFANSATNGKVSKWVRIRGMIDGAKEHAVRVQGFGEGAEVKWLQKNVDIDVQVSGTPTSSGRAVSCEACENLRVRVQATDQLAGTTVVHIQDCKNFTVDLGPITWTAENAANKGCLVKAGAAGTSTKGVIKEGPMGNRGTGKSTELENNATKVWVYPGPDESVALGTGEGNQKVAVP